MNINGEFCEKCQNLLVPQVVRGNLGFRCVTCNTVRDADASDTLRYEEEKGGQMALFATILETLTDDGMNPKVKKACPMSKCKGKFARQARLGDDMQLVSGCLTCGHQWFE
jgi:DNA-directed RNA polymerase subunit M/transcription elongation factor TFIIS